MSAPFKAADPPGSLAEVLEIERDWRPDRVVAYIRAAEAFSTELRSGRHRNAFAEFMAARLGKYLNASPDNTIREARRDALNSIIATAPSWLPQMAWALDPHQTPNCISFCRTKLVWHGNDVLESTIRRHDRRIRQTPDDELVRCAGGFNPIRRVEARATVTAIFGAFPTLAPLFTGIMRGLSIAEMARRSGRSRQQIYRDLHKVRAWCMGRAA